MAAAFVPPIDVELPGHRLQLVDLPVQRVIPHGFKQFGGGVHGANSIIYNIIDQRVGRVGDVIGDVSAAPAAG